MAANATINGVPIGRTSWMSETIAVQSPDVNPIRVQVHYDPGSQHSLGSKLINKVTLAKRLSPNPIVLSTVAGDTKEIKQLSLVKLSNNIYSNCIQINKNQNKYSVHHNHG